MCLVDHNTGEVIFKTKSNPIVDRFSLRNKIAKNIESFLRYFDDNCDRDITLDISILEQPKKYQILDIF